MIIESEFQAVTFRWPNGRAEQNKPNCGWLGLLPFWSRPMHRHDPICSPYPRPMLTGIDCMTEESLTASFGREHDAMYSTCCHFSCSSASTLQDCLEEGDWAYTVASRHDGILGSYLKLTQFTDAFSQLYRYSSCDAEDRARFAIVSLRSKPSQQCLILPQDGIYSSLNQRPILCAPARPRCWKPNLHRTHLYSLVCVMALQEPTLCHRIRICMLRSLVQSLTISLECSDASC